jgi:hypothetical protein
MKQQHFGSQDTARGSQSIAAGPSQPTGGLKGLNTSASLTVGFGQQTSLMGATESMAWATAPAAWR